MWSQKNWIIAFVVLVTTGTLLTDVAEARSRRKGLNFGTNVSLLDGSERTLSGNGYDRGSTDKRSAHSLSPYVGYSLGSVNFGLAFLTASENRETIDRDTRTQSSTTRTINTDTRGASFFMRFLFGDVFFLEAAGGLYRTTQNISNEYLIANADGSFTGERQNYNIEGVGPGYALSGGVEVPIGNGFYFTSAYKARMVQLRDRDGTDIGGKRSQNQTREILFGMAHYHR